MSTCVITVYLNNIHKTKVHYLLFLINCMRSFHKFVRFLFRLSIGNGKAEDGKVASLSTVFFINPVNVSSAKEAASSVAK